MTAPATQQDTQPPFGIAPNVVAKLQVLFDQAPGLERVWVYGSRARGDARLESDIDLAFDWPGEEDGLLHLKNQIEEAGLIYRIDALHWQSRLEEEFRNRILRDRKIFWEPRRGQVSLPNEIGATQLKKFRPSRWSSWTAIWRNLANTKRKPSRRWWN